MSKTLWTLCALLALPGLAGCASLEGLLRRGPVPPFRDPTTGMELVFVEGGCFKMGAPGDVGGPEERPAHEVCVGDLYVGRTEVTQAQWKAVMGANPSEHATCGDACPVENVSWSDAQAFLAKLNAAGAGAGAPRGLYRLPTEAEWEYAARSGGKAETYSGQAEDPSAAGWYLGNSQVEWPSPLGPHPVGQKAPNGLGLHDMTGNVWEWTGDWYGAGYYAVSPRKNPAGPATGEKRVLRGGGFANESFDLRVTYRNFLPPDFRAGSKGLRVVRGAPVEVAK